MNGAYRTSWFGRPGTSFVDLPADLIQGVAEDADDVSRTGVVLEPPTGGANEQRLIGIVNLLKGAKAPLIVIGKGAAYAKAEKALRELVEKYEPSAFNLP